MQNTQNNKSCHILIIGKGDLHITTLVIMTDDTWKLGCT